MRKPRDRSLLTTSEAAAVLGVSHDTIARMADSGELRVVYTRGGHRRIPRASIEAIRDGVEDTEREAA